MTILETKFDRFMAAVIRMMFYTSLKSDTTTKLNNQATSRESSKRDAKKLKKKDAQKIPLNIQIT